MTRTMEGGFNGGVRHIAVEVNRYDDKWVPQSFVCRVYARDERVPAAFAFRASPEKAVSAALAEYERILAATDLTAKTKKRHPTRSTVSTMPMALPAANAATTAPVMARDLEDLI